MREIDYLGHDTVWVYLRSQTTPLFNIHDLKVPTTKTELRSFIGLCSVSGQFV